MELRVLRYFLAVANEGGITRAAQALHVTQPTLSRQLMDLEEELGQQLLNRETHTVSLTPEGVLLCKRAEEILAMVHKTKEEFDAIGQNLAGTIYVGGGECEAMRSVVEAMADFHAQYPEVVFNFHTCVAEDVMERVENGLLDFGVLLEPADTAKYERLALPVRDRWGVLMRRDHPLAQKEAVTREDLMGVPLSCPRRDVRNKAVGSPYLPWFQGHLKARQVVAVHNLIYNASLLVEQGMGCALTLEAGSVREGSDVCFRPLEPPVESSSCVVWKRGQVFSKAASRFLKTLQERFQG